MRIKLLLLIFIVNSLLVNSQTIKDSIKIDSLNNIIKNTSDSLYKAKTLIDLTEIIFRYNPDSVIQMCNYAIPILEKDSTYDSKKYLALALNNIGGILIQKGEISLSLNYFLKSLDIKENINDSNGIASSYNNIAYCYGMLSEKQKAIKYYKKGIEIRTNLKDDIGVQKIYINLSKYYSNDTAIVMLNNALKFAKQSNDQKEIAFIKLNLGSKYFDIDRIELAENHFLDAISISRQLNIRRILAESLDGLGRVKVKQDKISEALLNFEESYKLSSELEIPSLMMLNTKSLEKLYKQKQNWQKAYYMLSIYDSLKLRRIIEENEKDLIKSQLNFEYKVQENELKSKEEQKRFELIESKKRQSVINLFLIAITVFLCFVVVYFYSRYKLIKKQKNEIESLEKFKNAILGMIVHDLKNPLNAILNYAEEVNTPTLKNRLKRTSNLMLTYVLNILDIQKMESQSISINQVKTELGSLINNSIIQIEQLALEKDVKIVSKIRRNYIVLVDIDLIQRVFVNLLTNAIKYSKVKGIIELSAYIKESNSKQLFISVKDYGTGINEEFIDKVFDKFSQTDPQSSGNVKSTGLGLTFCKLAVESHNGTIKVNSKKDNWTEFIFTLPLISDAGELINTIKNEREISFDLTDNDKTFINEKFPELKKLKLEDAVEVMSILEKLRNYNNSKINIWANKLENACLCYETELFEDMLNKL